MGACHSSLIVLIALQAQQVPAQSPPLAAWMELATTGPVVRVISQASRCPRVAVVATATAVPAAWDTPMNERAPPAPPDFPDRVCEWPPPPSARYVAVEGHPAALPVPLPNPSRIVVLGDTGCLGEQAQNCGRDWFFGDIARFAAARQPDLVIHIGDYNYRGTNCAAFDGCCTYNPVSCGFANCGDTWAMWQLDFFAPAAPLLAAAPWVMVRGNHELCGRAGHGYFRYLDPHSPPPTCAANPVDDPTETLPYPLYLGDALRLLVLDSSDACDERSERDQVGAFRVQFSRLAEQAADGGATQTWLLTHRPMWGVLRSDAERSTVLNYTLQQASGNRLPASISLVLSGHEHLFQSVTFASGPPPNLVVGSGGSELDDPAALPARVEQVPVGAGGPTIAAAVTVHDHGYLLLDRNTEGWSGTFYDRFDQPLVTCDSAARPSVCAPLP
jgi:hypothetical protein